MCMLGIALTDITHHSICIGSLYAMTLIVTNQPHSSFWPQLTPSAFNLGNFQTQCRNAAGNTTPS